MKSALIGLLVVTTSAVAHANSADSVEALAKLKGEYKSLGMCKMIDGNRTMFSLEVMEPHPSQLLPTGSIALRFVGRFETDNFMTYMIPGKGKALDPEYSVKNPRFIDFETVVEGSTVTSQLGTGLIVLSPSALGGPIVDLKYTTGYYEKLDSCQFAKIK